MVIDRDKLGEALELEAECDGFRTVYGDRMYKAAQAYYDISPLLEEMIEALARDFAEHKFAVTAANNIAAIKERMRDE